MHAATRRRPTRLAAALPPPGSSDLLIAGPCRGPHVQAACWGQRPQAGRGLASKLQTGHPSADGCSLQPPNRSGSRGFKLCGVGGGRGGSASAGGGCAQHPRPAASTREPGRPLRLSCTAAEVISGPGKRRGGTWLNPCMGRGFRLFSSLSVLDHCPRSISFATQTLAAMPTLREGVLDLQGFKPIPWLLNLPDLGNNHELGVLLAHGAGGDASSGNLPAFAGACTEAGAPCLRFTARGGSLPHRIKVAKVRAACLSCVSCRMRGCCLAQPHLYSAGAVHDCLGLSFSPTAFDPTAAAAGAPGGRSLAARPAARPALGAGRPLNGRQGGGFPGRRAAAGGARGGSPAAVLSVAPAGQARRAARWSAAPAGGAHPASTGQPRRLLHPGQVGCSPGRHGPRLCLAAAHSRGRGSRLEDCRQGQRSSERGGAGQRVRSGAAVCEAGGARGAGGCDAGAAATAAAGGATAAGCGSQRQGPAAASCGRDHSNCSAGPGAASSRHKTQTGSTGQRVGKHVKASGEEAAAGVAAGRSLPPHSCLLTVPHSRYPGASLHP